MEENFSTGSKYYQIFIIFAVIYHAKYFVTIMFVLKGGGVRRQGTVNHGRRHTFAISAEVEQ
jgi:hypothetical protein